MGVPDLVRAMTAAMAALLAGGLALLLAAPVPAAMLTALIACVAGWMAFSSPHHAPSPATVEPSGAALPEQDLGDLIEAIDEPLLLVDGQIVARANRAAQTLLGGHILGENVRLAIRHPTAAERLASPDTAKSNGPIELPGLRDHEQRWEMFIHPVSAGRRLVRLKDRTGAYAAEKMRVDFVANASHELRTPLATLLGFIETLQDQDAPEDAAVRARFLTIMFGEAKRMQQLVNDLISLSRIEAEKFRAPQTALDLGELIEEVSGTIRDGRPDDRGRLIVEAGEQVAAVAGDRIQLSQLLHNLIGNALKYGRPERPVRIGLRNAPGGMVRLSIADEGDGIAPEHLPRLTERFYRVDPGRSRSLGGTGLGLAIVKHIVERHRGRLDIDSEVGRGTTVSVLLPAAADTLS